MARYRTWEVVKWDRKPFGVPVEKPGLPLMCECGRDAWLPTCGDPGCLIIATKFMMIFTDPAGERPVDGFMPEEFMCRKCGRVYVRADREEDESDVR